MPALALVVRAQRLLDLRQRIDPAVRVHQHLLAGEVLHQGVHVLQLLQRRPVGVAGAPVGRRVQPDRERLGEVLVGMALRVPAVEMQHEALAVRLRVVILRIRLVRRAEDLLAPAALPQLVGVVDGVAGFVAQDAHAPLRRAPFDLQHVGALEPLQAGMRKVEGDRHAGDAVGREPLVREPEMRPEALEPARVELLLQLGEALGQHAVVDGDAKLAHPQIEELLVRPVLPLLSREHRRLRHPFSLGHSGRVAPAWQMWYTRQQSMKLMYRLLLSGHARLLRRAPALLRPGPGPSRRNRSRSRSPNRSRTSRRSTRKRSSSRRRGPKRSSSTRRRR